MNKVFRIILSLSIILLVHEGSFCQVVQYRRLSIDELFKMTADSSEQLKITKSGIGISHQQRKIAEAEKLPEIGSSFSLSHIGDALVWNNRLRERETLGLPNTGVDFSVEASQVVFRGGAIRNNIDRASLREQVAQLSLQRNTSDIKLLVLGKYLDLYNLYKQKDVYVINIELANLRLKNIRSLNREGMVTHNDITRSELQLSNLNLTVEEITNNIAIVNRELTTFLGMPDETAILPDTTFLSRHFDKVQLNDYSGDALNKLPEIKATLLNKQIAEKNLNIAKSEKLPYLSLYAGNSLQRPLLNVIPAQDIYMNVWQAGISVKYNISSLYHAREHIELARQQIKQEEHSENLQRQNSSVAANSAYIKYQESLSRVNTLDKNVQLANENYRQMEKKYFNQLALLVDMLDASNSKLEADLQLNTAKVNIIYSYYKLQRAGGNL